MIQNELFLLVILLKSLISMTVMVLCKFILPVYVDDTNKESCTLASQSIRRYIYGLINPHMNSVQEYVRVGLRIIGREVHPITKVNGNPFKGVTRNGMEGFLLLAHRKFFAWPHPLLT